MVKKGVIFIEYRGQGGITTDIISASGKKSVNLENDKITALVKIKLRLGLGDVGYEGDIQSVDSVKNIESEISAQIKKEVENTIMKVQNMKSDIFGFGSEIHRKYPKEWKSMKEKWNDIFPGIEINVEVESEIQRYGISNEQLNLKSDGMEK